MNLSPLDSHGGGPRRAVAAATVPLQEWIRRASSLFSKEDYLECAVTVALELTNRLGLITGANGADECSDAYLNSWSDPVDMLYDCFPSHEEEKKVGGIDHSSWRVRLEDIVPENVQVVILDDIVSEVTIPSTKSAPSESPQPSSRDVCFALGTILFEIFSQGDPLLLSDLGSDERINSNHEDQDFLSDRLLEDIGLYDTDAAPHASKRSSSFFNCTAANGSPPSSVKAKFYLRERWLPMSVCQLVSDLLENKRGNEYFSDSALRSVEEASFDLMRMKNQPQRFLHDENCPTKALEKTALFGQAGVEMYGREDEMNAIMDIVGRIEMHVQAPCVTSTNGGTVGAVRVDDFLCEALFLSGHSGSGKSTMIKKLVSACNARKWCVLVCKFDRQVAPLLALLHSVDSFFGKFVAPQQQGDGENTCRDPIVQEIFDKMSLSIVSTVNEESFGQLCVLLPKLRELFPLFPMAQTSSQMDLLGDIVSGSTGSSHTGAMGSGRNRLHYLLHIILKALCNSRHPVLLCLEDTQWVDSATLDIIGDFVQTVQQGTAFSADGQSFRRGLLYVGNFRDNEVNEDGCVMNQIECMEKSMENINVSKIMIGELSEGDVNDMLSFKLCIPTRRTRELAQLVYQKTRGNPMFTIEFLRSIVQKNALFFSVRDRKWIWDETSIDMQVISEGVVELLIEKLKQLPSNVTQTLMVISCCGFQINHSVIQLMDLGQFTSDMMGALDRAMKEGIIDRAGPIYAFSHDMLQETSYKLIPVSERDQLHKRIAETCVQDPEMTEDSELCTLAADQVNMCKDLDGVLSPVEKARYARLNLAAGKIAIRASSYKQARAYFEAGISLLHANHWDKQYSLSLQLYEYSGLVCFMDGKIDGVTSRLNAILSNAKSFDDKINTRVMLAKLYLSQQRYADGFRDVIEVLSGLGEVFPKEIDQTLVTSEINETLPLLNEITKEKLSNLPVMTDARKLNAMKFMSLLTTLCTIHSPKFLHMLSCRMIQLTFQFGFCEESITGLATIAHVLWLYFDSVDLSKRINGITEALIKESSNTHSLRAELMMMRASVIGISQPAQAARDEMYNGHVSATIIGDRDNAMLCGLMYIIVSFLSTQDLEGLQRECVKFVHEMAKHKRIGLLHSMQCFFNGVTTLIGNYEGFISKYAKLEWKSNEEIYHVAKQTQNNLLTHYVIMSQMHINCFFRRHLNVAELSKTNEMNYATKRALDIFLVFYEGISALALARDTKLDKWRKIGEKACQSMARYAKLNVWTYENKFNLLHAELHYLNERHMMAQLMYQAAILSASEHKLIHEEALARELYGIYFVENKNLANGMCQLKTAMDKYRQWGATKKADDIQDFMEIIWQTSIIRERL